MELGRDLVPRVRDRVADGRGELPDISRMESSYPDGTVRLVVERVYLRPPLNHLRAFLGSLREWRKTWMRLWLTSSRY